MPQEESPQYIINQYQRRQRMTPMILGIVAALLIIGGIVILVFWFRGSDKPLFSFSSIFPSETPTVTITVTATPVTPTVTITVTPTETVTPTITVTPTPSGPFEYIVEEGDNCWDIAIKFEADYAVLLALNNFGGECPINVGDKILIPAPDTALPTNTPVSLEAIEQIKGTIVEYQVQQGDNLDTIAQAYLSTVEDIMERNELENANTIFVGQILEIKVGLVTPVPTSQATATETPAP